VAPGIDIARDVLAQMEFKPIVPDSVALMDARIFADDVMGISSPLFTAAT